MSEATAQLPDPFDDPAIRAFAETAARLYASEDLDDTLRRISTALVDSIEACAVASVTLLESRQTVGMAVGILMERFKISAEQAFDQLRETSQRLNIKLREIAQRITTTGQSPDELA